MKESTAELLLGAIVTAIAVGFFAFAFAQSGQATGTRGGYEVWGAFQRVDGITVGSDVRVSGVKVGVVSGLELDPLTYDAKLTLSIDPSVELLDDTNAAIRTDGLLGGAHVALEPAGVEVLPPGSQIIRTQGSVDLLTLILSAVSSFSGQAEEGAEGEAGATETVP